MHGLANAPQRYEIQFALTAALSGYSGDHHARRRTQHEKGAHANGDDDSPDDNNECAIAPWSAIATA
jgi:hypothetical protein